MYIIYLSCGLQNQNNELKEAETVMVKAEGNCRVDDNYLWVNHYE